MKPGKLNLTIYTGFQFQKTIRLKDATGEFIDLTGYTPFAEVRENRSSAVVLDLAPTITDATSGEVTIDIADETTDALTKGAFVWDLMLEDGDDKRLGPYVAGRVEIEDGITQPA